MKRFTMLALLGLVAAVAIPQGSFAKEGMAKAKPAQYMVISPHTPEQCMKAIDDASAAGSLSKWQFGCEDNDHTGYMIVTATNAEDALKSVPADERPAAKAIKLHKFTAAEIKSFHEKMAGGGESK